MPQPDAGSFYDLLQEAKDDHFYGAWHGGKASAGGGPVAAGKGVRNPESLYDKDPKAREALARRASSGPCTVTLHDGSKVFMDRPPTWAEGSPPTLICNNGRRVPLRDIDSIAQGTPPRAKAEPPKPIDAAGRERLRRSLQFVQPAPSGDLDVLRYVHRRELTGPVREAELIEGSDDHFYGAWVGGRASAGGHPQAASTPQGAVDALVAGKRPTVNPDEVREVLDIMSKRTDDPDLTKLKVRGTLKFGGDGLGMARKEMPQMLADKVPQFLGRARKEGIRVTPDEVRPQDLHPMQREVSGRKAGGMLGAMRKAGGPHGVGKPGERIIISRDNFVLDGHHRWGAATALSFEDGYKDMTISVIRVGLNARDLLHRARGWTEASDIAYRGLSEAQRAARQRIAT